MPPLKRPNRFASATGTMLSLERMKLAARTARTTALLVVSSVLMAAGMTSVCAAEYRLGVLQVENDDSYDDATAPLFMQELRATLASRSDVTPVDIRVTLTQLSLGQGCNTAESSCLLRIANNLKVDGILFGKLTHEGGEPVAILRRYDTHSASIDASALVAFSSEVSTPEAMRAETLRLVNALFGAPAAAVAQVKPVPEPVAPAPVAVQAEEPTETTEGGISGRTIAGIALLGGTAVSVGLTVLSFVQIDRAEHNRNFENYRVAVGQNSTSAKDVCDEASTGKRYGLSDTSFRDVRRSCNAGGTFEILQYVFLGSAVVTGGLATFLLLGDDSEHAQATGTKSITLRPTFTRSGMSVTARMRF